MTASLTPLGISVLALLSERAMHPYEMYQLLISRHEDRIVKVRPGSLYHTVERLAKQELVQAIGTERDGNRPERTSYAILPAGREALQLRLTEILGTPVDEYPQFPLGLSEAHNLPARSVIALLSEHVRILTDEIAEISELIQLAESKGVPEAYWLTADYLRTIHRSQCDWITQMINRMESEELSWPANK